MKVNNENNMKHFTEWMEGNYTKEGSHNFELKIAKRLLLKDGTSLSIQAGWGNYCYPRNLESFVNLSYKEYEAFEIGFPNKDIPEIFQYAESGAEYTNTVYPYVPKQVIEELIEKRGGVVGYDE